MPKLPPSGVDEDTAVAIGGAAIGAIILVLALVLAIPWSIVASTLVVLLAFMLRARGQFPSVLIPTVFVLILADWLWAKDISIDQIVAAIEHWIKNIHY